MTDDLIGLRDLGWAPGKITGGPAFPCEYNMSTESGRSQYEPGFGLTWLDWMAAHAPFVFEAFESGNLPADVRSRYDWAEAMLAEKRKREGGST